MNQQKNRGKITKCSCDLCVLIENAEIQKNCSAPERLSHCKTNKCYYKNYAVPDDQYYCKENINHVKLHNRKSCIDPNTIRILANLRKRACRILENSDGTEPCEEEEEEEELQKEVRQQKEQCTRNPHSKAELQLNASARRIQNLGYSPRSNFLKNIKRQAEEINTNSVQCYCANCAPQEDRRWERIMCPCCKCHPLDQSIQNIRYDRQQIKRRNPPYSDISSMHDHCTCFRTWRPNPCAENFPEYQYEMLKGEDRICAGESCSQGCLDHGDDECEDYPLCEKKGKSGHISRSDNRRRRSGRGKNKRDEKDCPSPEMDFSPSLKRPHPNSCERCWRYASPSRSPVNRPCQRFDPNYRRSHSQVNITSESKENNLSKRGSRDSGTNCAEFDRETKVHDLISSVDRSRTRIKSADNVKKTSLVRPTTAKPLKKGLKGKDVGKSQIKKEQLDSASKQERKNKGQKIGVNFAEKAKETFRKDRQSPMQCSPSMFDKKSQKSNLKQSTSNHANPKCGKENVKIKPRPSSACQTQTSTDYTEKPRSRSSDRNYLKENFYIPPELTRKCCCTRPKPQTVNMNLICDQPRFYQGERNGSSQMRGLSEISNNQQNHSRLDTPCLRQDRARSFADIHHCVCSCRTLAKSKFRGEGLSSCCSHKGPVTLWDRKTISKDETGKGKKPNEENITNKSRNGEEHNPRKYCVFYMNESKENENGDDLEVLVEELTEGRSGKGSKSELKSKMKKLQDFRSDSMALRFQKGIAEKCRRHENNRVFYF